MSEYDHMMRGGKTGSGPMADHIQARPLCFFCARHASGPRHLPADMHLLLVAFFSLTYFFQSNVDRRERLRKCVHFSVLFGGLLTSSQACYGDDRFEQGRVLYEEPLGADGMQALPHTASHRRFVQFIFTCSYPTLAFRLRHSPFMFPKVPTLPIHRASVIRRT